MTVKKSFSIFIIIVIISICGVLFFSIDSSTFLMLKNADPKYILYAAILVIAGWSLDALKFWILSHAAGEKLSIRSTFEVVWINYFGCAITPMQSGGGPFQIYLLYRNGISIGKSVAITLVRTLQVLFLLGIIIPFSVIFAPDLLQNYKYIKVYLCYVIFFISGCAFLISASVFKPVWIKKIGYTILNGLNKIKLLKNEHLPKALNWVNREVDVYNTNIKLFTSTGKWWFILSIFIAAMHLIVYMSIMPCLIKASGFSVNYIQCILAEAFFIFMLYFVPTPGASGAAEGGAVAILTLFVPWNIAGVMAITWRLISEYSGVFIGMIIAIKMLGWIGADKIMKADEDFSEKDKNLGKK